MVIAAGTAFYLVMIVLADVSKVTIAFEQFSWWFIVPVIGLVLANYLLRAERWHSFLANVDLGLPRSRSYRLFFCGLSMSVTPGKVGEALKALLLKTERNAPVERGIGIVFVERMSDIVGMIILIGVGTFAFPYGLFSFAVLVAVVAGVIVLIISKRLTAGLVKWLKGRKRLTRVGNVLEAPLRDSRQLLTGRNFLRGTAFSILAWSLECVAFYLILTGSNIQFGLVSSIFVYAFSSVIGAISMLPGGMGTTEATMAGLLLLRGVAPYTVSFAVILTRVITLWFAVAVGLLFLVTYPKGVSSVQQNGRP